MKNIPIAIIGSGNMGASLIGGLIADGYNAKNIWVTDLNQQKLDHLQQQFYIQTSTDNKTAVANAEVVIFAIKPQAFATVAADLQEVIRKHQPLIISIAAGIPESSIQQWLGGDMAIVRSMPNTPALIGYGATALFANTFVTQTQHAKAEAILRAVGIIVWLQDEKLMDVVTALSGSGPAYFFLIMESLQQSAESLGLPADVARQLTLQTALGAAKMALDSPDTLTQLREKVTSPGGTTESALRVLNKKNIQVVLKDAVTAAVRRSEELAAMLGSTQN